MDAQVIKWRPTYSQARKTPAGKYQLFYRGTMNEVFPGELFHSASEAKTYYKAHLLKKGTEQ